MANEKETKGEKNQIIFSSFLKEYRKDNQLSQTQLASKLGVTQGYISQIEKEFTDVSFEKMIEILKVLKINNFNIDLTNNIISYN